MNFPCIVKVTRANSPLCKRTFNYDYFIANCQKEIEDILLWVEDQITKPYEISYHKVEMLYLGTIDGDFGKFLFETSVPLEEILYNELDDFFLNEASFLGDSCLNLWLDSKFDKSSIQLIKKPNETTQT